MCYKVECQRCKKYSWGGCGQHLPSVYKQIEKGKHCRGGIPWMLVKSCYLKTDDLNSSKFSSLNLNLYEMVGVRNLPYSVNH
ncbi:hypothetical protein G4B88_001920 [Cannabis sativa]|uniref:Uncharacterized protein n=1 Tax=Cannabis sativa TaxID=3483 RepID=A0A7J6DLW1_CANSA|nr:hypothetical protein G4B88_016985 [Cannabis sativa]KAF4393186.1 hypothetical protein G4B88_001920 [Cannabis sativa]